MSGVGPGILRRLPFLQNAGPDLLEGLAKVAFERTFQPGEVIIQENSTGRELYVIVKGLVEIVKGSGADAVLLGRRGAGEFFGEMAFLEAKPRFATVYAVQVTRLLEFSEEGLHSVLVQQPLLLYQAILVLMARLREADLTMIADLQKKNLELARLHEERLAILRQQLAQVTAAQEEERQRIARELHDGVGPALASLNLRLHTAGKLVQPNPAAAQELQELAKLTQANIQDIRRLIYDLHPAVLDELGLVAALKEHVDRYQHEQGLQVKLALPEGKGRLPAHLETTLFRVIQEALTNAAKHARAKHVDVRLDWEDAQISLRIADDGRGFDLQEAAARAKGGQHLGLWSMRERIEQLDGRLQIESRPGAGTTIQATVPLMAEGKS